ncbi:MAG TPA: hypothetical protein VHR86_05050, partial [Armatimonadota bacterium]|nr:hypothetical protein [Armatimonadota bacterium]
GGHARRWAARFAQQLPIILAAGINFGVLALLFLQVAYYRAFYPATILMAWPWFSIVLGLVFAYSGVYLYAIGIHNGTPSRLQRAAGGIAALLFLWEGFTFANGLSLMTHVDGWQDIWRRTSIAGAPLGIGLNLSDPTLWPRWLMLFSLALTSTGAYAVIDAAFFAQRESEEYRRWAGDFAFKVFTAGLLGFAIFGSWYVFGTWHPPVRQTMFHGPALLLTTATALSPGLPWLLLFLGRRQLSKRLAAWIIPAQYTVLAINAWSRQLVQNLELRPYLDVAAEPVHMQWGALLLFLGLFLLGLAVLAWILQISWKAVRAPEPPSRT